METLRLAKFPSEMTEQALWSCLVGPHSVSESKILPSSGFVYIFTSLTPWAQADEAMSHKRVITTDTTKSCQWQDLHFYKVIDQWKKHSSSRINWWSLTTHCMRVLHDKGKPVFSPLKQHVFIHVCIAYDRATFQYIFSDKKWCKGMKRKNEDTQLWIKWHNCVK